MKKIVLLVVLMMCVGVAKAQWTIAPEVGVTVVNRAPGMNDTWEGGWKIGVATTYQFNTWFSLKSGLHYTQRGYSLQSLPWIDEKDQFRLYSGENKRHFLQIPLMAEFGFNLSDDVRLNVAAGPYMGFCISHSYSYTGHSYSTSGSYGDIPGYGYGYDDYFYGYYGYANGYGPYKPFSGVRKFDWGATFSAGLEVKNLYFNVGYDLSLGKEYDFDEISGKYHMFSLTVGYKFRL